MMRSIRLRSRRAAANNLSDGLCILLASLGALMLEHLAAWLTVLFAASGSLLWIASGVYAPRRQTDVSALKAGFVRWDDTSHSWVWNGDNEMPPYQATLMRFAIWSTGTSLAFFALAVVLIFRTM